MLAGQGFSIRRSHDKMGSDLTGSTCLAEGGGWYHGCEGAAVERAWWVLVDPKRQRKPKRVSVGEAGKRAAEDVAKSDEVQLALGHFDFSKTNGVTFETYATTGPDTHGRTLKCGRGESKPSPRGTTV